MHKLTNRSSSFARVVDFDPDKRSSRVRTYLNDAVLIGEEVTAQIQSIEHLIAELGERMAPSGFLSMGNIAYGSQPNAYTIESGIAATPIPLLFGGRLLYMGGASSDGSDPYGRGSDDDRYNTVVLPAPPSTGERDDLVFLEIWFQEIASTDEYYPWGCTQYLGSSLTNDLLNTTYTGVQHQKDLVLRWKIRTVADVDFSTNAFGLGEADVFARGNAGSDTAYIYTNMYSTLADGALWRAGDGSDTARGELFSTDGYSYAFPLQRVHRRNTTAYALATNPNGAGIALGGSSDRPDGLFNDEIAEQDVQDLRFLTRLDGASYDTIARESIHGLLSNQHRRTLAASVQAGHTEVAGTSILAVDGISATDDTNVNEVEVPDDIRRVFSDEAVTQLTVGSLDTTANDTDLSGILDYVSASRTITIDVTGIAGATVSSTAPTLRWRSDADVVAIVGAWSGLGTDTATVVLDNGDAAWDATAEFMIEFGIVLPGVQGLSRVPDVVHQATINGTDMYTTEVLANLNLTNIVSINDFGIQIKRSTRAIQEIGRRQQVTANGSGVAKANGKVLVTSAGTAVGSYVYGLGSGGTANVIFAYTPTASDKIWVYYDHVALQTPALPTTLGIEMLWVDQKMLTTNLGTGGGTAGVPYLSPMTHIPENSALTSDGQMANLVNIGDMALTVNTGLVHLPIYLSTPHELVTQLSSPGSDSEGRTFYGDSNVDFFAASPHLNVAAYHRTVVWAIARITSGGKLFQPGTLVLLAFSNTSNDSSNTAGVRGSSTYCVGAYPLFAV